MISEAAIVAFQNLSKESVGFSVSVTFGLFFRPRGLPLRFFGGGWFSPCSSGFFRLLFKTLGAPNLFILGLPRPRGQFINSIGLNTVFVNGILGNVGRGSGVIDGGVIIGGKCGTLGTGDKGGKVSAGDKGAGSVDGSVEA